ncbi:MAG: hypothetical protein IKA36_05195 [Clostridia bacterium]|nr:hypothetical protein [Clostridia bacterium]
MTFIWDIYRGAYRFTEKEEKITRWFLRLLIKECPKTCSFLLLLDLDKIEFYWAPGMTIDNGIQGAWCVTSPNRIYMVALDEQLYHCGRPSTTIKDDLTDARMQHLLMRCISVTMVHELTHMLQFKTNPFLYSINRLVTLFVDRIPFLEMIGIEYDARSNSETEEFYEFVEKLECCISTYTAAIHSKPPSDENFLYLNWCESYPETSYEGKKFRELTLEYVNMINE